MTAHPSLLARMVKTSTGSESQSRAAKMPAAAEATDNETIRQIGRVAMAARNAPVEEYERSLHRMLGDRDWPSPAHNVTCVDCYSGERLVIDDASGVPISTACAASSSLPGINGSTWVGDHYCMDGSVSTSSTHADLLAGAERVVIFTMMSLTEAQAKAQGATSFGFAEQIHPGPRSAKPTHSLLPAARSFSLLPTRPPKSISWTRRS